MPPPQRTAEEKNLFNAIDSATPERLQAILKKLSTEVPGAFPFVQSELLLKKGELKRAAPWKESGPFDPEDSASDVEEYSDEEEDSFEEEIGSIQDSDLSDEGEAATAASRQRFEICGQCKKEYDTLQKGRKSCRWHSGE